MVVPALPDDILHVLCEELASQRSFDTLFQCACANRAFAVPALTHLYRAHHLAPVRGGDDDETISIAEQELVVQKWTILWRSVILSSMDGTLFPYCRYIKILDLRDLQNLLEDPKFKGKIQKNFFSGPLAKFETTIDRPYGHSGRKYTQLDHTAIINAVGEALTEHTPMLEAISGRLIPDTLIKCAPRLERLRALELYDGNPLEDQLVQAAIRENCPQFDYLSIFTWSNPLPITERPLLTHLRAAEDRDHKLSEFLGSLRPHSLRALETIREVGLGAETFLALNNHGQSLKDLRLALHPSSLPHLSLLRGCTAIETLRLEEQSQVDLEKTQNDVFLEAIDWLRSCKDLRDVSLTSFVSASSIVMPLLLEEGIGLRKLEVDSYLVKDNQVFHQALTHQRSTLRALSLSGDAEQIFRDDVDILVDSLKQLTELRELKLLLLPEVLGDDHLVEIMSNLTKLQELYITGLETTDALLEPLSKLRDLRTVTFNGISKFTADGLLEFISNLGPGNQGIVVQIDMADPENLLSEEELALVQESIAASVGGRLGYLPFRDPDIPEFEGDSD